MRPSASIVSRQLRQIAAGQSTASDLTEDAIEEDSGCRYGSTVCTTMRSRASAPVRSMC